MSSARRAKVRFDGELAGWLTETDKGFEFRYEPQWMRAHADQPLSLSMPTSEEVWAGDAPRAFFLGLLPEGWLFDVAVAKLKLSMDDAFGLVAALCNDCPGAVSVEAVEREGEADDS